MKNLLVMILSLLTGWSLHAQKQQSSFTVEDPATFSKTISDSLVQRVDVRTAREFAQGHLPDAVNMDVNGADFDRQIASLDKNRPVALYCHSGVRSKKAAQILSELGFKVYELKGGIINWKRKIVK